MNARKLTATSLCLAAALVLAASSTYANATMKWCTSWRSQYSDSGHGEDVFYGTAAINRTAQYSRYRVTNMSTSTDMATGYLDASGCTPYLTITPNTEYRFSQGTLAYRTGFGLMYVHPDNATWGPSSGYIWYNSYMTTAPYLLYNQQYEYTFTPTTLNAKTNLMPVYATILGKGNTLGYPPTGNNTYVHTDCNDDRPGSLSCCGYGGAYYIPSTGNICLGPGNWGSLGASAHKFIAGHEVGHRVSNALGGPFPTGYGHDGQPYQCGCSYVTTGSQLHCLNSLEPIGGSAGEGFANFFSAAIFNDRSATSGVYVYGKQSLAYSGGGLYTILQPPYGRDLTLTSTWGESHCDLVGTQHKGVELDWTEFFWHAWTKPDQFATLAIPELYDVWIEAAVSFPPETKDHWNNLLVSAGEVFGSGSPKHWQFFAKGLGAGIAH